MKTQTPENLSTIVYSDISPDALLTPEAAFNSNSLAPEGIVKNIAPGNTLTLSDYVGNSELTVPSLEIETFRGNEAIMVPLFQADPRLETMYHRATKGREERAQRMGYEMLVRILDTSGADGLHHMHSTDTMFPRTIFYNVRPGGGLQLYMTSVGETDNGRPILGILGATNGQKDERNFLRLVGKMGSSMKGRR